jgi:Tol biopolymer transport system component
VFGAATSLGAPNSAYKEGDPVVSQDGLTLYFISTRAGAGTNDVYIATRASTSLDFGAATPVTAVNTSSNDDHFFVSANGLEAFVSSDRTGTTGLNDIFRATRTSTSNNWGTFTALSVINTSMQEYDGHLEADGLTLWFTSGYPSTPPPYDIYYTKRTDLSSAFGTRTAVTALNSSNSEMDVSLSDDGRVVLFRSDRDGTLRVYYSTRSSRSTTFGTPQVVTGLDQYKATLVDPFISSDGCSIYFSATLTGGAGQADLYYVKSGG